MTDRSRFLGDAARLASLLVRADVRGAGVRPRRWSVSRVLPVRTPATAIAESPPEIATEMYVALSSPLPVPPPPSSSRPPPSSSRPPPLPAPPSPPSLQPSPNTTVALPLKDAARAAPLAGAPSRIPHIPPIVEPKLRRSAPLPEQAAQPGQDATPPSAELARESPHASLPEDLAEALNLDELAVATPHAVEYEEETTEVKLPPLAGALDPATVAENLGATTSGDSFEERFEIFVGWLVGATGAMAVFVADTDGLSIEKRMAPEAYVAASATLGQVQDSLRSFVPSPPEGSTTVELDGQNILQLIWTDTELGRLVTGLVLSEPLQAIERGRIRSILRNLLATRRNTNGKSVSE